jgi:hypothetical protein
MDPSVRAEALLCQGLVHTFRGEHEPGVRKSQEATALARELGPAAFAGALLLEAQARLGAGELDRAEKLLAEAQRIGGPLDTKALWHIDTLHGDLAMQSGRPRDALEPYARSLEAAELRGDALQVLFDLQGVASALALLGADSDALEVSGLVEAQGLDIGGAGASYVHHTLGSDPVTAAEQRVGAPASQLKARGGAVPGSARVARACQLARAHQRK